MIREIEIKDRRCIINSTVYNWSYTEDFLNALCNVDPGYYLFSPAHTGNARYVREEVYTERIFAYEFYHQYRCIMSENGKYSDIFLNGEQTKTKEVVPDLERCAPDLVMHKKIEAADPKGQLWLCEIKMARSQDPLSDIRKFHDMASLQFKEKIFLFAGGCKERLLLLINEKLGANQINPDKDGNVICVCSSCKHIYDGKHLYELYVDCHRLGELIKLKKNIKVLENELGKKKENGYVLY